MGSEHRLTLTLEDFAKLVRGKAVERDGVALILADIGYAVMLSEVAKAINES